jgi:alanine dehydrogenase
MVQIENGVKGLARKTLRLLTLRDVRQILTMKDAIKLVETAFREKGLKRVQMPPKPYLFFKQYDGDLRIMPSYLEGLDEAGVKMVNVHPANPEKYEIPTIMATILLFDPKTGAPISIMDGTWITAVRTAAATAVATKYLARKDSKIVGIIGVGYQAPFQLEALNEVLKIESVRAYRRNRRKAEEFAAEMNAKLGIDVRATDTAEDAVRGVDVLTTLTPVRTPVVKDDWITEGMHINGIGADAPGKEELEPKTLKRLKIVVDDWEQASHSGEINVPLEKGIITKEDVYAEIGEIVAGIKPGRVSDEEITLFDSTGLSIQDVITSWHVYRLAEEKGVGSEIPAFFL